MYHKGGGSLSVLREISFLQLAHSRDDDVVGKEGEKKRTV